jgi:hypothetical protein
MNLLTNKISRLGTLLIATLAIAAIIVPAAAARVDMGMGRVDADAWGVSEYAQQVPPVKGENYYARGVSVRIPTLNPPASTSSSNSFQWGDAGVGASFALGFTALAGAGLLVIRRQRGPLKAS